MDLPQGRRIEAAAGALARAFGPPPAAAVVLGSGWTGAAAGLLRETQTLPCSEVPGWPEPRVAGHGGDLVGGLHDGRRVLLCSGRVHAYEGWTAAEIVLGVRALLDWGVPAFVLLNAAGSLDEARPPGSFMPFSDHLNLGLPNPLAGGLTPDGRPVFLDLVDLYDPGWRAGLLAAAPELVPGVYAGLPGPTYETPAEVRRLRRMGADAVGMSTIPEALAARAGGAAVLAVSLLTNFAAGIRGSRPSHGEVLEEAAAHARAAQGVLAAALASAPGPGSPPD